MGIIPAAGYATRLQPLRCSKEVYPIHGRPVMDYLVERMRLAGCSEIRIVTRSEKLDVVENASRHGATVIEAYPRSLAKSFFTGMKDLPDDDIVLLGYPDSIWEPPDGYSPVIDLLGECEVALGLFHTSEPQRCEVVTLSNAGTRSGQVAGIELRPPAPTSNLIWGCAAARASVLRGLEREREPGEYFNSLCSRGAVAGVWLSDTYVDIGTSEGLREALAMR